MNKELKIKKILSGVGLYNKCNICIKIQTSDDMVRLLTLWAHYKNGSNSVMLDKATEYGNLIDLSKIVWVMNILNNLKSEDIFYQKKYLESGELDLKFGNINPGKDKSNCPLLLWGFNKIINTENSILYNKIINPV